MKCKNVGKEEEAEQKLFLMNSLDDAEPEGKEE